MPRIHTAVCDGCDKDVTFTTNIEGYYLEMSVVRQHFKGHSVSTRMSVPPIDQNKIFCNVHCVSKWLAKQHQEIVALQTEAA